VKLEQDENYAFVDILHSIRAGKEVRSVSCCKIRQVSRCYQVSVLIVF